MSLEVMSPAVSTFCNDLQITYIDSKSVSSTLPVKNLYDSKSAFKTHFSLLLNISTGSVQTMAIIKI